MDRISKTHLAQRFGQAAPYYHYQAEVQRYAADRLLAWYQPQVPRVAPGKILEVGCGTGFLSQGLVQLFPEHRLEITDLAPEMVAFCQQQLVPDRLGSDRINSIDFYPLDAEQLAPNPAAPYSLIASSFALQWFHHPIPTLARLVQCLHPQGSLLLAFPSNHSFPEWKQYCNDRQIPCTLNPLPEFKAIVAALLHQDGVECEFMTEWYSETYDHWKSALQHLKSLGAGLTAQPLTLSVRDLKTLLAQTSPSETSEVQLSYHLVFVRVQKRFSPYLLPEWV